LDEEERNQAKDGNKSDDDANSPDQANALIGQLNADNNNTTNSFLKLLKDVQSNGDVLMKMVRIFDFKGNLIKYPKFYV
jgi:hypothetical protein